MQATLIGPVAPTDEFQWEGDARLYELDESISAWGDPTTHIVISKIPADDRGPEEIGVFPTDANGLPVDIQPLVGSRLDGEGGTHEEVLADFISGAVAWKAQLAQEEAAS